MKRNDKQVAIIVNGPCVTVGGDERSSDSPEHNAARHAPILPEQRVVRAGVGQLHQRGHPDRDVSCRHAPLFLFMPL